MLDAENIPNLLVIAGIVIGGGIAIYIAYRQGVFSKTYLFASCGKPFILDKSRKVEKKHIFNGKNPLWAICFGVPDVDVYYYLLVVPFVIKNNSNIAVKNIYVQLRSRLEFDPSGLSILDSNKTDENVLGIKGQATTYHGKFQFDITVPTLNPRSHLTVFLPIAIDKGLFCKKQGDFATRILRNCVDNEFIIDKINCYFSAESLRPREFETYLLIALLRQKEKLQKKTEIPLLNLHELNCPNLFKGKSGLVFKPVPWSFWYSLMFPACRKKKPYLLAQSRYDRAQSDPKVLVEDFNSTSYIPGLLVFNQ